MENGYRRALQYLPPRLADAAARCAEGSAVTEIRLRAGGLCTLTADGKNLSTGVVCLPGEIEETVARLTGGSLYAEADNIREGVITAEGGIRAGVCGRAVAEGGRIRAVRDITSVNLRIPRRVPGAADALVPHARAGKSILVYSPPGRGKTTVLRELCIRLASRTSGMRIAVIDTRCELSAASEEAVTADFFRGYPRAAGMEAAVRSMSPELLICDELAGEEDARAVRGVRASGVAAAVSVHASSEADLGRNPAVGALLSDGLFDVLCGIRADRRPEVRVLA